MRITDKGKSKKAKGFFSSLSEKNKNLVLRLFVPGKDIKEVKKSLEEEG